MNSGVAKIFSDTKILLEGTSKKLMTGKWFYQAMNTHVQVFEYWILKEEKDGSIMSESEKILDESKLVSRDNTK